MNRLQVFCCLAIAITASQLVDGSIGQPTAPIVIPLDQLWALRMPGTRPMNILRKDGNYLAAEGQLVDDIRRSLTFEPTYHSANLRRCFAVRGNGEDALAEAYNVLSGKTVPPLSFPTTQNVSLIIFSRSQEHQFALDKIVRYFDSKSNKSRGNSVEVSVQLHSMQTGQSLPQLVIIPLGKAPLGMVHVRIDPSQSDNPDGSALRDHSTDRPAWRCAFSGFQVSTDAKMSARTRWPTTPEVIPIAEVYGWNVAGVLPFGDSDILKKLRDATSLEKQLRTPIQSGFAVSGSRLDALRQVHDVFVHGAKPTSQLPATAELTAVFFSRTSGTDVHLQDVTRFGNDISVRYRFAPHVSAEVTEHIALIPLGRLSPGKYHVNIVRSPMDDKYRKLGFEDLPQAVAKKIVCKSFSFEVSDKSKDD